MRKEVKFHQVGNAIIFDEPITLSADDRLTQQYEYDENTGFILNHIYLESPATLEERVIEVINELLNHLPDSEHTNECWDWCWEELNDNEQVRVKEARDKGYQLVIELIEKYKERK